MASANILDICTCEICLETFDESSKCPRILSCGHSFCYSCLGRVLALNPCCPTCRAEILFQSPESIPVNYSLKSLINIRSQSFIPNTSANLGGVSEEAYKELKQKVSLKVKEELGQRKTRTERLTESLRVMEEERNYLNEEIKRKKLELKARYNRIKELKSLKAEENKYCDKLKELQTMVENSANDADFSKNLIEQENLLEDVKEQIPELKKWLEDAKKQIPVDLSPRHLPQTREALETLCLSTSVYAVEDRYDGTRYGKVTMKNGRILVASFQQEKPENATLFALPELLSRFNTGSSELPKMVFLRVTPNIRRRDNSFEVIIKTDGLTTPRGKNCILFCSGLKGPSYKGLAMNYWNDYSSYQIYAASPPFVDGPRKNSRKTPLKEGAVYGMWDGYYRFWIQLKDQPSYSSPKFGNVIAGLQRLKDLQGMNCSIEECGLVI